jgi:hypothetical protein
MSSLSSGGGLPLTEGLVKAIEEGKRQRVEALLAKCIADDINGYYVRTRF